MNRKIISIIAAVLFSLILWGSVSLSEDYYVSVAVPIRIIDLPDKYMAESVSTQKVYFRLKGEGWRLSTISLGNNLEYLVSANHDSGKVVINLNRSINENDWLTSGVQVFQISPDTISARIEKIYEKKVKIIPKFELEFRTEYGLASPARLLPDSILVFGTRRKLHDLEGIPTEQKKLVELERKTTNGIELVQFDGLIYSTNHTTVILDVQKIADKVFDKTDIEVINIPGERDIILFPNKIDIVLRGGINVLGRLTNDDLKVVIDYNKIIADTTGTIDPEITIPDYTTLIDKKPNKLKYIIKKY